VTLLDSTDETITRSLFSELTVERSALGEDAFGRMIVVERKRTERSGKPFLLMLLEAGNHQGSGKNGKPLDTMVSTLM
jgi:hypothetical protein